MPVTHQWKPKPKSEEQPAAAASPTLQPAAGKKGTQTDESSGKKGRASTTSHSSSWKDDKQPVHSGKDEGGDGADDDSGDEEDSNQPGRIRNLAGFFATQRDEPKDVRKKRFEVADDPETIVLENEPERLEGVIRADDPGEWQKPIELEKGWAKNLANRFLSQQQDDASASKKPFVMDIEEGAQTIVLENEPVILEGVVRSVDKTEDVIGKRGRIKNIAGRFANPQADDATDRGGSCWREPVDHDPSRTRGNVADKWKNQLYDEPSSPTSGGGGGGGGKPKWMLELESAKEYGVFENEPEVRSDVVRADDENPDVISAQHTRNLRKMWSQIEREEIRDAAPSKRPDILIRPKKKEPSPEPEPPPPPPVEETKPARRFGAAGRVGGGAGAFGAVYGRQAKKEKTPPPPEPEPPKQPTTRRGFRQVGTPSQPPAQPVPAPEPAPTAPDPKNPFKTALKPVPRRR